MTCREFRDLLIYLAFGDLPAEQQRRADEHVGSCAHCAAEWGDYQRVKHLAGQLPSPLVPPDVECRLQAWLESLRPLNAGDK